VYDNFDNFNWETMDTNRNDFEDEETEEEKIEIGPDENAVQEVDPTVQDLPGRQDLSSAVTDLAADLPVHVAVIPKKRPENQMIKVEEVEEIANPIAEVQQWVLKDALCKHFSYAYSNGQIGWPKRFTQFQKEAMPLLLVRISSLYLSLNNHKFLFNVAINGESRANMSCAFVRPSFALKALPNSP
jgi:hypothetical protein